MKIMHSMALMRKTSQNQFETINEAHTHTLSHRTKLFVCSIWQKSWTHNIAIKCVWKWMINTENENVHKFNFCFWHIVKSKPYCLSIWFPLFLPLLHHRLWTNDLQILPNLITLAFAGEMATLYYWTSIRVLLKEPSHCFTFIRA